MEVERTPAPAGTGAQGQKQSQSFQIVEQTLQATQPLACCQLDRLIQAEFQKSAKICEARLFSKTFERRLEQLLIDRNKRGFFVGKTLSRRAEITSARGVLKSLRQRSDEQLLELVDLLRRRSSHLVDLCVNEAKQAEMVSRDYGGQTESAA